MVDNRDGGRRFIPRWDGNPGTFRVYVQEVELWAMTEDLNVKYAIAARLVQNFTGAVRRACQGMTKAELSSLPPLHDEIGNLIMEGDPAAGIQNVLNRLKEKLGPQTTVRKGQSMSEFFRGKRYHRAATALPPSGSPTGSPASRKAPTVSATTASTSPRSATSSGGTC